MSVSNQKTGVISQIYGAYYKVVSLPDCKHIYIGKLRGRLRLKKYTTRHLLQVGDRVLYRLSKQTQKKKVEDQEYFCVIENLLERKNQLLRCQHKDVHVLAANIEHAVCLMSLSQPEPSFSFLDRFITSAKLAKIDISIIFTKVDLISKQRRKELSPIIDGLYPSLVNKVYVVNALDIKTMKIAIEDLLQKKSVVLVGQSGVGKSTFFNALLEKEIQKSAPVSQGNFKGKHITTNVHLYHHPKTKMPIVDVPGVSEWGVEHLKSSEIHASFKELEEQIQKCAFNDCRHLEQDKSCAVIPYLQDSIKFYEKDKKEIPTFHEEYLYPSRYTALQSMLKSISQKGKRK